MKKLFLTLGAILVFGVASAQTDSTKTKAGKRTQTERSKKADKRTPEQQKSAAERNIDALERSNTTMPTPPSTAPGAVNTNSSAMPQVTPPVTTPPPGEPMNPVPPGAPTPPTPVTPPRQ